MIELLPEKDQKAIREEIFQLNWVAAQRILGCSKEHQPRWASGSTSLMAQARHMAEYWRRYKDVMPDGVRLECYSKEEAEELKKHFMSFAPECPNVFITWMDFGGSNEALQRSEDPSPDQQGN